ncbi:MAG: phosphodiesterase [Burkholderiales bacterium]|nr:phosphodiesterase [Burkholderiales bacterium]MDQ3195848.1 phosphodiesterase [Pseudomonadota bacterium]
MLIAQITDFHINAPGKLVERSVDTAICLERAVAQLLRCEPLPDIVLATGDLAETGRAGEYAYVRELLAPITLPLFVIPGNHDERGALRSAFRDHTYLPRAGEFLQYAIDDFPLRLIALDTVIAGAPGGELCEERLGWLDARLREMPDKPTVVFMHHPPFPTGIRHMDRMSLANPDVFGAIIARHPQIERVLCGHVHRSIQVRYKGTIASICPGTAHQIKLDLRPDGPAAFTLEPPGFQLHFWDEGTGLVTHTASIGVYPSQVF